MTTAPVHGMYSAIVIVNNDPQKQGRVRVRCPQILGTATSGWAKSSEPTLTLPQVGDQVWLQFEGGDVARPVYTWPGGVSNFFTVTDSQGKVVASITKNGNAAFKQLSVSGENDQGLIIYGRDFSDWMKETGKGVVAWASAPTDAVSPTTTSEVAWFEMVADLSPDRMYQFSTSNILVESENEGAGRAAVNIRAAISGPFGTPNHVTLNSGIVGQLPVFIPQGSRVSLPVMWNRLYRPQTQERWRFLISVQSVDAALGRVGFHTGTPSILQGWSSTSYSGTEKLVSGQELRSGGTIVSRRGVFYAAMNKDGNFVLYSGQHPVWFQHSNSAGSYITMQADGNLVIYRPDNSVAWTTNTGGNPGAYFTVQDDGNMVIYSSTGTALWQSGTSNTVPHTGFWVHPVQMMVRDAAIDLPDAGVGNESSDGSTVNNPDPRQTYEKVYTAKWTATYNDTNTRMSNSSIMRQGPVGRRFYKSLVGFPEELIDDLFGATVSKLEISFTAQSTYTDTPKLSIGYHNIKDMPLHYPVNVSEDRYVEQGWYVHLQKWVDISHWASDIQAGRINGVSLGPGPTYGTQNYTDYTMTFAGVGSEKPPIIRVTYTK